MPDQTNTAEAVEPAFVDVVQRILDENSAWVASPNRQVTESIAIRAFVAARMSYEDMHTPATEMMRQRDDARQQRDEHFAEIERARDVIAGQRLEADRLRSRIMEMAKALGECADALESNIRDYRQPGHPHAEILERRYEDDMTPVRRARVLTEGAKHG